MADTTLSAPEHWLPVIGYEGYYEVSDLGRVRSVDRIVQYRGTGTRLARGRVLATTVNPRTGRNQVYLWRENRRRTCRVYALVAEAFIGPRPKGREVAHNNGESRDDRLLNLRYATKSENNLDQVLHGTHPESRKTHCANDHPFSGDNLYFAREGRSRKCKVCSRMYAARYRAKLADRAKGAA